MCTYVICVVFMLQTGVCLVCAWEWRLEANLKYLPQLPADLLMFWCDLCVCVHEFVWLYLPMRDLAEGGKWSVSHVFPCIFPPYYFETSFALSLKPS